MLELKQKILGDSIEVWWEKKEMAEAKCEGRIVDISEDMDHRRVVYIHTMV